MDLGYIVEGEPLVGVVVSHPEVSAFTLQPRDDTTSNILVSKNSTYKVVGHILSDPELLEEKMTNIKSCQNCRFHEEFTGACFNADSPYCADFTDSENVCEGWEKNEETTTF